MFSTSETELEWSLWYHLYDDEGVPFFADGDTIEFRVARSDGTPLASTVIPTVTVEVPIGYIGFNPAESPGHIGPFVDTNDNMYALVEASAHNPLLIMVKSTDGGDTWAPVDMAGVPAGEDLEGIDAVQEGDVVHVAHWVTGTLADGVYYHRFNLSDHSSPDQWAETDTVIDNAGGAGLARRDQNCTISVLSNGDLRVLYQYEVAPVEIGMRSRISGTWDTSTTVIFDNANGSWTGVTSVIDPATDIIYAFAHDDDTEHLRGKAILANGSRQNLFADTETTTGTLVDTNTGSSLEEEMNFTPPILWDDGGTKRVFIAWVEDTTLDLESATIQVGSGGSVTLNGGANSTTFVSRNVGQGRMPDVTAARDSTGRIHLIYALAADDVGGASELYRNWSDDDGATWESTEVLADTRSWENRISMPRAFTFTRGGGEYLGWVYYDATLYEEDADPALLGNDAAEFMGHVWYEEIAFAIIFDIVMVVTE